MARPLGADDSDARWVLSPAARIVVTRLGLLLLLLISIDGAFTWYVTDEAAGVVATIEERDGVVATDESELGTAHRFEIERASAENRNRIRQGDLKWIPAALVALLAGLLSPRADPPQRRSVVMMTALTLAIWVTPRVLYSRELPVLDAIFG